ncbi:MAG: DUF4417 domain-containing protein [Ruminococcus flavefaciens]|nr:DUF4417 domain-containing protein [Ruminococcus flavefaciens]
MEEIAINNFINVQYDFVGNFLTEGANFIGKYDFPILAPQQIIPTSMPLPINYMLSESNLESKWFHCFVDDSAFERLWRNFYKYIPYLKAINGIISTDFSIYRDIPMELQIRNCYRNRVMAYAMQKINHNVIPTAGFGDENTWDWCFDGLPKNSTLAITTNGTLSDPEARRLFVGGVDALVRTLQPYAIVVCGNYPEWLNNKYPDVKIIPILSYSQMWNLRRRSI